MTSGMAIYVDISFDKPNFILRHFICRYDMGEQVVPSSFT